MQKKLKRLKEKLQRMIRAAKEQRQPRTRLALAYAMSRSSRLSRQGIRFSRVGWLVRERPD
jgi:hypothetical protein